MNMIGSMAASSPTTHLRQLVLLKPLLTVETAHGLLRGRDHVLIGAALGVVGLTRDLVQLLVVVLELPKGTGDGRFDP